MTARQTLSNQLVSDQAAWPAAHIRRVGEIAFALWLILSLITPSWRYGPFAWLPLWEYEELAGGPMRVGAANLLPLVVVACTALARWRAHPRPPWTWGPRALSLPLAGLTILGTLSLDTSNFRLVFIYGGMYAVAWLVYLYVLNERPRLLAPIAAVLLIQGAVAAGQFLVQRDLGLIPLGELPLHPAHEGNSVLLARGQPWLRAYGLTIHPNLLGALLATLLLLALPALVSARSHLRMRTPRGMGWLALAAAVVAGGAGLFLSFSRAAWLGFAAGLGVWGLFAWLDRWAASSCVAPSEVRRTFFPLRSTGEKVQRTSESAMHPEAAASPCVAPSEVRRTFFAPHPDAGEGGEKVQRTSESAMHRAGAMRRARQAAPGLLVAALLALGLFATRDLVFSRFFALDSPTEAQSITDRLRDAALALAVIRDAPLTGVGLGEYLDAAQQLNADAARVHNVPLLVAAELGLPGLLLWLWLMVAPFWLWLRPGAAGRRRYAALGPRLAPWVAMLVINTFDTTLWLSGNWQTAFLFALVAANVVVSGQWSLTTDHYS